MIRTFAVIAATVMVLGPAARGNTVLFQETFATDTSDMLVTYGFSNFKTNSNVVGNPRVVNGVGTWTGGASGVVGYDYWLWKDVSSDINYDWSQPLTYSADIGSQSNGGGQSYGIMISNWTSTPQPPGLAYNFYWPSSGGGAFLSSANANSRITNDTNPDVVASSSTLYTVALTVRQNASDVGLFDYKVTVNGTAQTVVSGSLPAGVTQDGDWYVGVSKATYGIDGADPFDSVGIRADGLGFDSYIDNMSVSVVPEPSVLALLPLAAAGGLAVLRRRSPR